MRVVLLVFVLSSSCRLVSCLAPAAEQLETPLATQISSATETTGGEPFDHSDFDAVLGARVAEFTVDYAALKLAREPLDRYIAAVGEADLGRLNRNEQKALLINAYNAFTLALILEHYPVESIKDIDAPWKTKRWRLAGDVVSLDDIEHGLLRPIYKDPRIHFAVNCASVGCPPLAGSAYRGDRLDEQLDSAARRVLNSEPWAKVEGDSVHLTSLMLWYRDDFVDADSSPRASTLLDFVRLYRDDLSGEASVSYMSYDWGLNE